jgi:hypothetical protein
MDLKSGKIADPELRTFANADADGDSRTVIVELSLPPVAFPQERTPRPRGPSTGRAAQLDVDSSVGGDAEMTKLERELKKMGLGRDLVRLNQAQAFVVNVSPGQLRALSESPLVGAIRPNRIHRMPLR